MIALALTAAALSSAPFLLVLLLVGGWGFSPLRAAGAMLHVPAGAVAVRRVGGAAHDPSRGRLRAAWSRGTQLASLPSPSGWWLLAPLLVTGTGVGLALPAIAGELLHEGTPRHAARTACGPRFCSRGSRRCWPRRCSDRHASRQPRASATWGVFSPGCPRRSCCSRPATPSPSGRRRPARRGWRRRADQDRAFRRAGSRGCCSASQSTGSIRSPVAKRSRADPAAPDRESFVSRVVPILFILGALAAVIAAALGTGAVTQPGSGNAKVSSQQAPARQTDGGRSAVGLGDLLHSAWLEERDPTRRAWPDVEPQRDPAGGGRNRRD